MSSNSSNSSGEEGNTSSSPKKQISPAKRWLFVLNNYTENEISSIVPIIKDTCVLGIIGKEVGEKGTPHLQGYIEFKKKARPVGVFQNKRIHFKPCKGNRKSNIDYCSKDDDVILWWGCEKPYKVSIELFPWQKWIKKNILDVQPDDRSIYWFWETKGCAGKTTFQKWIYQNYTDVIMTAGRIDDMKNGVLTYMNTKGKTPKIVLVNIPRVNSNHCSIAGLECIKDMWFYSPKYEGGMVCGANPHILVFANEEPDYEKLSGDRLKVYNLKKDNIKLLL